MAIKETNTEITIVPIVIYPLVRISPTIKLNIIAIDTET